MAGAGFFSGFSATIASVVTSSAATDAASCRARRHLGWADDAGLEHVEILARLCIEAVICKLPAAQLLRREPGASADEATDAMEQRQGDAARPLG